MKPGFSSPYKKLNFCGAGSDRCKISNTSIESSDKPHPTKQLFLDETIISDPENIIGTSPKFKLKINEFSSRLLHLDQKYPFKVHPTLRDTFHQAHDKILPFNQGCSPLASEISLTKTSRFECVQSPTSTERNLKSPTAGNTKLTFSKTEKPLKLRPADGGQSKSNKWLQDLKRIAQPNLVNQPSLTPKASPTIQIDLVNQLFKEKEPVDRWIGKAWPGERSPIFLNNLSPRGDNSFQISAGLRPYDMGLISRNLNVEKTPVQGKKKEQRMNSSKCEKKEVRESVRCSLKNTVGDESPSRCDDSPPVRVNTVRALENKTKCKSDVKEPPVVKIFENRENILKADQTQRMKELKLLDYIDKKSEELITGLDQAHLEQRKGSYSKILNIADRKPDCAPIARKKLTESADFILERNSMATSLESKLLKGRYGDFLLNVSIFKEIIEFLDLTSLCYLTRVCKKVRSGDYVRLMRKMQCRVIIQGLKEEDQYGFWNFHVNFDFLQRAYPLQFMMNAMKPSRFERDILSDIDRTYAFNDLLDSRQNSLLKVLIAFSNTMPKIGYIQGLNSIAAVFLSHKVTESEAYWLMKYIFKKKKFDEVLTDEFSKVQLLTYQLEIYMRNYVPEIIDYLGENGMNISYFATQWFITIFSYDLELSHLTKIWNLFLLKGWKILIRVALTILWHFRQDICSQSSDDLPSFLKTFVRERITQVSEEELFGVALSFKVSNRLLKGLETLYEHSAPINVLLVSGSEDRLEWKIVSDDCSLIDASSATQKNASIMEYLNENIEHIRKLNKSKHGSTSSQLDNYKAIHQDPTSITLTLDNVTSEYGLPVRSLYHNQSPKFADQTLIQTLSNFGQKLKQILTPKDHSPDAFFQSRKNSNTKPFELTNDKDAVDSQGGLTDRSASRCTAISNNKGCKLIVSSDAPGTTPFKKSIITALKDHNEKLGINLFDPTNFNAHKNRNSYHVIMSGTKSTTIASTHECLFQKQREIPSTDKKVIRHKRNPSFTHEPPYSYQKQQTAHSGHVYAKKVEEPDFFFRRNTDYLPMNLKDGQSLNETDQSIKANSFNRSQSLHNNFLQMSPEYSKNDETSEKRKLSTRLNF